MKRRNLLKGLALAPGVLAAPNLFAKPKNQKLCLDQITIQRQCLHL
jgi:hypothetical protein